ncbi:MAG TPA: T9SS type A sorting domain-containing protein [Crocinitomix sp.]|nr:T9SS type A sorting domain-containing protein [Crocinitomix sp.]
MRKLTLLIVHLTVLTQLFGQEIPISIIDRINSVNYIFEGEVISSEPYFSHDGRYIHTSNTVEITKLLKGDIECGTIEIITLGGDMISERLEVTHTLTLSKGSKGIFLCSQTNRPVSIVDFYSETNPEKLEASFENQSFIRYWWDGQGINASDIWNNYDSLNLLYNSTEAITGLSFIDCEKKLSFPTNSSTNQQVDLDITFPNYLKSDFDSLISYIELQRRFYTRENQDRDNGKIFYNTENLIITGNTTKYLEFDITVKDDLGIGYLDQSGIRLKYNTSVFGSNVVSNNNIIVTRGTLNSDPNCYSAPIPSDDNSFTVLIPALETTFSQCKAPILTTPQSIMHIKMEILDCNINSSIILQDTATFFGPSMMIDYSAYADFPADTFSTYYEFIEHNQIESVPNCVATITEFSPLEVAGGIGEVLNIRGFQFGDTRGDGVIFMKNADDGGTSDIYLDALDYVLWSDTLIQIKVPSYDTAMVNNIANEGLPAGTGTFKVFTDAGDFAISPSPLKIKYSISNHSSKNPYILTPRNEFSQAYVFHCDTAVANYKNGAMKDVIDKALRDWKCLTGINWYMGADTIYSDTLPLNDTICIIRLGNIPNSSAYARTTSWSGVCGEYIHFETDITLDTTYNFYCDTLGSTVPSGQQSLYSIILHELGHAHGLKHVIDINAVMHYGLAPGAIGITNLNNDISCDEGGNWMMDFSTSPVNITTCSSSSNITRFNNPCSQLDIVETTTSEIKYNFYPNPVINNLNINFYAIQNNKISIKLFDMKGATIVTYQEELQEGDNNLNFDVSLIPNGVYILQVKSLDNQININSKIIKNEY